VTNAKRGRASHRALHLTAIAALGLALAGCGGSQAGASATASPAQSATPTQSAVPAPAAGPTQTPTSAQGSSTTPPGTATGGGTSSPPPSSGSAPANPPTATVGNVTLNWTPPTQNVDNTPLTNLAGYDIHYGTASGQYTQTIAINNPGIATYVVSNLSPGTYYFTVAAVNSQGTESPLSSEVSATVN
jgi:hypothetical protein